MNDDETAQGILNALTDAWEADGLTTYLKESLVAYASDGAPVVKTALKRLLEDFLGRSVQGIHCLAHRAQLAFRRAFKSLKYVYHFESMINEIYIYFNSHSHKTKAHFRRNFADFKLKEFTYIFEVRWIASEQRAISNVVDNLPMLMKELDDLSTNSDFSEKSRNTAMGILNTLKDRSFQELLFFFSDLINHLSKFSLEAQRKASILTSQVDNVNVLLTSINKAKDIDERFVKQLLKDATCDGIKGCTSVLEFEQSEVVELYGFKLDTKPKSPYRPLSTVRKALIEKLEAEIQSYIPEDGLDMYKILDNKMIPENEGDQVFYGIPEIMSLSQIYNVPTTQRVQEWKKLLKELTSSSDWCKQKHSEVRFFWSHYLKKQDFIISPNIRKIIQGVLVTPIGSADAERGFSVMNHVRTKRRSRLNGDTLDAILRIRINGPKELSKFDAPSYARWWRLANHMLSDSKKQIRKEKSMYSMKDGDDIEDDDTNKIYMDETSMY